MKRFYIFLLAVLFHLNLSQAAIVYEFTGVRYQSIYDDGTVESWDHKTDPNKTTWFVPYRLYRERPRISGYSGLFYYEARITGPRQSRNGLYQLTEIPDRWPSRVVKYSWRLITEDPTHVDYLDDVLYSDEYYYDIVEVASNAYFTCRASQFTKLELPSSIRYIRYQAFGGPTNDGAFVDFGGNPITNIFHGYETVVVPSAVEVVERAAFLRCRPNKLITPLCYPITNVFGACPQEVVVNGPSSGAFKRESLSGCLSLNSVQFTNSLHVTDIGRSVFEDCASLTSLWGDGCVRIPNSVTNIGARAFYGCASLQEFSIPDSVLCLHGDAFVATGFWNRHPNGFVVLDGWLLGYKGNVPKELVIPQNVRRIARSAFEGCTPLVRVVIPPNVEYVDAAFRYCVNLRECRYNSTTTLIEKDAFTGCSSGFQLVDRNTVWCTVRFDGNGADVALQERIIADETSIGDLPNVDREGYRLLGWFTEPDGGCRVESSTVISNSCSLYAQWEAKAFLITKNFNYDRDKERVWCRYGSVLDLSEEPHRVGYRFLGWYTEAQKGDAIGSRMTITGAREIYAYWGKEYPIVYHPNGGTGVMTNEALIAGEALHKNAFSRDGFVFAGWALSANGDVSYVDGQELRRLKEIKSTLSHSMPSLYLISYAA